MQGFPPRFSGSIVILLLTDDISPRL